MSSSVPCADRTADVVMLYALYDAFNARAMEQVLAHLHPKVEWGNGRDGGTLMGRPAVEDYWRRQFAEIDPTVTPTAIVIEDDGRLSVSVHQVVRALDGTLLRDGTVRHLYRISDGMVLSVTIAG